ncbi:MAG: T9SS type A sorting domain-containing protein [Ignavibacteria bacterium]|nr:T9SS type A sorting domain-containing protein [Ignavibacteria bacterium]
MKKILSIIFVLFLFGFLNNQLQSQTLRERIGQMVWTSFSGTRLNDTIKIDLQKRNLGGVILFAGNITSPSQVRYLNDTIKMFAKTPPFIAVDQEGGRIARLSKSNGFDASYSAFTLGTTFNIEDSTRKSANIMASWLKQSGFNVNLAPVADVNVNPNSPAIGKLERSYSQFPQLVANHAAWFINEFNKQNIIACLKHFPGHGSALQDSHLGFTDITNTWTNSELIPYQSLISTGYDNIVMTGHLYNSKLDVSYPASLSKKVTTDLLRSQIGFSGVAITDGMSMQAITNNYSFEDAVELAVNAGNDILLYTSTLRNGKSLANNLIDIIEQRVLSGKISQSRINEAYTRIINLKSKFGLLTSAKYLTSSSIPENFKLYQNYPNPFNTNTTISYHLDFSGKVSLKVFDILGREITTLVNSEQNKGFYTVHFDSDVFNLSSGIYYYSITTEKAIQTKKMILVK